MSRPAIAEPFLLLCEGLQDKLFFEELFKNRGIQGFRVECPETEDEGAWGLSAYPTYFGSLIARTRPGLRGFLVTRDADDDAAKAFAEIVGQLKSRGYQTPANPLDVVPRQATPNDFTLMVMLIPPHKPAGCLETLLWPAAAAKWPNLVPCVDAYSKCIGPAGRTPNQESRMRLRALLAAAHPQNPHLTLTRIWKNSQTALPLNDPNFNPVVDAVRQFCAKS